MNYRKEDSVVDYIFLETPFSMIIYGPSSSGKTHLVANLIKNNQKYMYPPPQKILYCYNHYQPIYQELEGICQFIHGISEDITNEFDQAPILLILDDLMNSSGKSAFISDLFTRLGHHYQATVILLSQNLFFKGPYSKDIGLNVHYIICMKNPRDASSIVRLGSQIFGEKEKATELGRLYRAITTKPYTYMFLSLKPTTDPSLSVLSHCFGEEGEILYAYPI